jgi:hypothetical protein
MPIKRRHEGRSVLLEHRPDPGEVLQIRILQVQEGTTLLQVRLLGHISTISPPEASRQPLPSELHRWHAGCIEAEA